MSTKPVGRAPGVLIALLAVTLAAQLIRIAQSNLFSPELLQASFVVGAGADVSVPARAITARRLVDSAGASSISVSPSLTLDSLFYQRLGEYAYPVRLLPESPWHLAAPGEPAPAGCNEFKRSEDLVLYRCAHGQG